MWMKKSDGFRVKGRQTLMIPFCWGKLQPSFSAISKRIVLFTCLVSFPHTFHYWLTHSTWVPVTYDLSLSPSFFPLPLFSSLQFATFPNCQRSDSLMVSFSTSCHYSIKSLFHPFLYIAPDVGQQGSSVFHCHPGSAVKWAREIWQTVWKLSIPGVYLHADVLLPHLFPLSDKPGVFLMLLLIWMSVTSELCYFKFLPQSRHKVFKSSH